METKILKQMCIEAIEFWAMNSLQEKPTTKLIMNKKPKGFPRGTFACETVKGKLYDFDAIKILQWLKKQEIEIGSIT